jgi:4-hydroxy-tetrahydrodipicolinate synthase
VARDRPDWRVFMGPEHLLVEALRLGAHGGVNGGALDEPGLLVGLYEAALRRDEARTAALQSRLLRLGAIFEVDPHASAVVKGLKCALSLLGLCSDLPAEPLTPFGGAEREKVRATLSNLGLLKPGAGMASPAR